MTIYVILRGINMFMVFKKFSLRQNLIFFVLILFLLITAIQLSVTFFYFRTIIVDKTQEYFNAAISQIGERINSEIKACNLFASRIIDNPTIAYSLMDINQGRKSKEVLMAPVIGEVLKLKPGDIEFLSDVYLFPITGETINCFYSEALDEIDFYSKLIINRLKIVPENKIIWDDGNSEKDFISAYFPIISDNSLIGLLRIRYNKLIFSDIVGSIALSSDNTIQIVDGLGKIVFSNDYSLINRSHGEVDLKDSFIIEHKLYNEDWRIYGVISNSSIYTQIAAFSIILLLINGIVFLITLISIFVYTNRILSPLNNIVSGMKQIQQGNLDIVLPSDPSTEFGFIAENFNKMVYRINSLVSEIYDYQAASRRADMAALEAKLNPHFLYNTLDTIYWSLLMKDNSVEADLVVKLAGILRYSLTQQDNFVPLWEDFIQIENYIILNQSRFRDKLTYSISIADDIRAVKIPKLLLQPLVENSFKHGFSNFTMAGHLEIIGYSDEDKIMLIVKDNGKGIPSEELQSVFTDGFGLRITRDRILFSYGGEYGIEVVSKPDYGTEMVIKIARQPKINLSF